MQGKKGFRTAVRTIISALIFATAFALPILPPSAAGAEELTASAARIAGDDARTRIVIDFDKKPEFSVHYLENPDRIVVDIDADTHFTFPDKELEARGLFSRIRYGAMSAGKARIVLTTKRSTGLSSAETRPNEDGKGWRLVLDAEMIPQEKYDELIKQTHWHSGKTKLPPIALSPVQPGADGEFLVAVDAGHGGIDTGATTHHGKLVLEKNITLAFAKALTEKLNARPGVKALLTRDSDVFLSLSQRVQIAREHHANLFISLHADTLRQRSISGSTVYTISDKASDRLAAEMARRENTSDEIAGVELDKEPSGVSDILIDLTRRETQAFSINLANSIVNSFKGQVGLINNPHRSAGFQVLTAPDIPSVLIELGFLSNKHDVKLLQDPAFREKVVIRIADAVHEYRKKLGG